MRKAIVLALLFLCTSCMVIGRPFHDEDAKRLEMGMHEEEVINILKAKPTSRSSGYPNGTYLLQWIYSYGTPIGGGGRHLAILFDSNNRMIEITHQFEMGRGL